MLFSPWIGPRGRDDGRAIAQLLIITTGERVHEGSDRWVEIERGESTTSTHSLVWAPQKMLMQPTKTRHGAKHSPGHYLAKDSKWIEQSLPPPQRTNLLKNCSCGVGAELLIHLRQIQQMDLVGKSGREHFENIQMACAMSSGWNVLFRQLSNATFGASPKWVLLNEVFNYLTRASWHVLNICQNAKFWWKKGRLHWQNCHKLSSHSSLLFSRTACSAEQHAVQVKDQTPVQDYCMALRGWFLWAGLTVSLNFFSSLNKATFVFLSSLSWKQIQSQSVYPRDPIILWTVAHTVINWTIPNHQP